MTRSFARGTEWQSRKSRLLSGSLHYQGGAAPKDIAGHEGAYLLQRQVDGCVEFLAVTLWDSIETNAGILWP
jgi:hypothetical protein